MHFKPTIVPDFSAQALATRANGHLTQGRYAEAFDLLDAAIASQPKHMPSLNEMGNCLKSWGRHREAVEFYHAALRLAPNTPEIHMNLGATYLDVGLMREAAEHSITAISLNPRLDEARWNLAITLLSCGQMKEGWAQARARMSTGRFQRAAPTARHPIWNGEEGAKVICWGEQGLGERILYAPMVNDLAQLLKKSGGKVFCDTDARMAPILQRSFPDVEFVLKGDVLDPGEVTHQVMAGDLGPFFRNDVAAFPPASAFLKADPRRVRSLRRQIKTLTKKKIVGLSWRSGNSEHGGHKSMTLFDLEPLIAREDILCINLQYDDTREERAAFTAETGLAIADAGVDLKNDLESLAALMLACDAVVSVSNTHAHLAGALGVQTFVALPRFNARFWYWFLDRKDSPWYPGVEIFRQHRHGHWNKVVEEITAKVARGEAGGDASSKPAG